MRDPDTPHGFPPERDPWEPFPAEIPWQVPISDMGWWLEIVCVQHGTVHMPLRLLAARLGWNRTLAEIVPKLKCQQCGRRPARVLLVSDSSGEHGRAGARVGRLDLSGAIEG